MKIKLDSKTRRQRRIRAKIKGRLSRPRLTVFRSLKHIYGQIIDDKKGNTLVSVSDLELQSGEAKKLLAEVKKSKKLSKKMLIAYGVGKLIAQKAQKAKIKQVVFDRGPFKYHGRIRAVAEGAREGGLEF